MLRSFQHNVLICNRKTVFKPLAVTDRDLSAPRPTFVSICNSWVKFWPLDVTDRDILQPCRQTSKSVTSRQVSASRCYRLRPFSGSRPSVLICNSYEAKRPLVVTDRDKLSRNNHTRVSCTPQRPYHWRLHSSAKSARRGIPASLIFSASFPGFLSSSNVNLNTLCPSIVR